jgi:hypothetical protein
LYKKDLVIKNPKKFQRHLNDVASGVLVNRGYYLNGKYSKYPYLTENGIANIADFHGLLVFVKNHSNYNLVSRIIGIILSISAIAYWFHPLLTSYTNFELMNFPSWILIAIGMFLIFYKFGKDIAIEIRLVGESYRTDTIENEKSIEYLDVRSNARLTVQAAALDPAKTLSDDDIGKLYQDGTALTSELTPFLKKYLETAEECSDDKF